MSEKESKGRKLFITVVFLIVAAHFIALAACFILLEGEALGLWTSFLAMSLSTVSILAAVYYLSKQPSTTERVMRYIEEREAGKNQGDESRQDNK